MPLNIEIPQLEHKYIRLYDTEAEYETDKDTYEEVCYSIVKSIEATEDNYSEYQYSTRTTNNDNEVKGKYWDMETPNIYAGLKIIWGYFGWTETTIELLEETLQGGNFYDTGKVMSVVKSIPDGDTLQHIDYFLYYLTGPNSNSVVKEIQTFDTDNIKSAMNFTHPYINNYYENPDIILNQLIWNNILRANMYFISPVGNLIMPNIKYFIASLNNFNFINSNSLEYLIIYYNIINQISNDITINCNVNVNPLYSFNIYIRFYNKIAGDEKINITINFPISNKEIYYSCSYNNSTFVCANSTWYKQSDNKILFSIWDYIDEDNYNLTEHINTITINDSNNYYYGWVTYINYILDEINAVTLNLNINDSPKYFINSISNIHLNNVPINKFTENDGGWYLYNNCIFDCDFDFNLNTGELITNNDSYYKYLATNVIFKGAFNISNLNKIDSFGIDSCTFNNKLKWTFPVNEDIYYKTFSINNCPDITDIYDNFHITIIKKLNAYSSNYDNSNYLYQTTNSYNIFSNCGIKWENHPEAYFNIIPLIYNKNEDFYIKFSVSFIGGGTDNIKGYINKDFINLYEYYNLTINNKSITLDIPRENSIDILFSFIGNNTVNIDLSTFDVYNMFEYKDEEDNIKNWLTDNNLKIIVKFGVNEEGRFNIVLTENILTFKIGNLFAYIDTINIKQAINLDIDSFINSIINIDTNRVITNTYNLEILRTQYNNIDSDVVDNLLNYFDTINIEDNESN